MIRISVTGIKQTLKILLALKHTRRLLKKVLATTTPLVNKSLIQNSNRKPPVEAVFYVNYVFTLEIVFVFMDYNIIISFHALSELAMPITATVSAIIPPVWVLARRYYSGSKNRPKRDGFSVNSIWYG